MRRLINSFRAFHRSKFSPRFPFFALPRFQKIHAFPRFSMPCLGPLPAGPYLPAPLRSSSSHVFNRSTFSSAFPFRIFPRLNQSQVFPHLPSSVPHSPGQSFFPVSTKRFPAFFFSQVVTCFRAFPNDHDSALSTREYDFPALFTTGSKFFPRFPLLLCYLLLISLLRLFQQPQTQK